MVECGDLALPLPWASVSFLQFSASEGAEPWVEAPYTSPYFQAWANPVAGGDSGEGGVNESNTLFPHDRWLVLPGIGQGGSPDLIVNLLFRFPLSEETFLENYLQYFTPDSWVTGLDKAQALLALDNPNNNIAGSLIYLLGT